MREPINDRKQTDIMKRATQSLLALAVTSFCTLLCVTDAHAQEAAATDADQSAELAKKLQRERRILSPCPLLSPVQTGVRCVVTRPLPK